MPEPRPSTQDPRPSDTSFHALQRRLTSLLGSSGGLAGGSPLLEISGISLEPPRLISAELLERGAMRARPVLGEAVAAFAAFLDGTQTSRVFRYFDGYPVIHGSVAAAVRVRRDRRLTTWREPVMRQRLYAPRAVLRAETRHALDALNVDVVDTTADPDNATVGAHPFAIRDAAIHLVQKDREAAERTLAEAWCASEGEPLFIDGGISGSERVAVSRLTVGVVKSHRTLYAEGDALQVVFGLGQRERSSVFRVTSPKRTTVASWYLRLRDPANQDPLWGLVRVEVALSTQSDESAIGARADEVSRWILAEVSPLSLPDARWDKMVYPIHDCEQYLKGLGSRV